MDALLELFWKSSLLLAGAGAAALLARRASAATRHLIWAAGLTAALALPLGSALLPRVRVAALPPEPGRVLLPAPAAAQLARPLPAHARTGGERVPAPSAPLLPEEPPADEIDWARVARLVWASVALALLLRIAAGDLAHREHPAHPRGGARVPVRGGAPRRLFPQTRVGGLAPLSKDGLARRREGRRARAAWTRASTSFTSRSARPASRWCRS